MTAKISAFVITYNRPQLLRACLLRARFADELIVIDKSSTDGQTPGVAHSLADRYERVPWSPLAEDTREYAASLCSHDWILWLDDDEILSPNTESVLRNAIVEFPAPVYALPVRNYTLGRWDGDSSKCDYQLCFYQRGAIIHAPFIHHGIIVARQPVKYPGDAYIDHLGYPDVASWISMTNRYTSITVDQNFGRYSSSEEGSLVELARQLLATRLQEFPASDNYSEALALLHTVYDIVEALKCWESRQPNGHCAIEQICQNIEEEFELVS
jgi:glycosyltransferase involved in cell wall biosynthesis